MSGVPLPSGPTTTLASDSGGATFGNDPDSKVASTTSKQGGTIKVTGWGFAPGSQVKVWLFWPGC